MSSCLPIVNGITYYRTRKEPRIDEGKIYKINPKCGLQEDPTFEKTEEKEGIPTECQGKYTSNSDPRLIDPRRGERYNLNRAPYQSMNNFMVDYKEIYGDIPSSKYGGYEDVKLGHYMYYIDTDISQPYHLPNYVLRSDVHTDFYNDPMGGRRVNYTRVPITSTYNGVSCGLTEIDDRNYHLEDLNALRDRKKNEQRYENTQ